MFKLVGAWEANPAEKKISHSSPLGLALMGKGVGDEVEVDAPAGKIIIRLFLSTNTLHLKCYWVCLVVAL